MVAFLRLFLFYSVSFTQYRVVAAAFIKYEPLSKQSEKLIAAEIEENITAMQRLMANVSKTIGAASG
ncbi:MAG: hypothetical protein ACTH7Q_02390 [Pseudoalteromonas sp.]